MAKKIFILIGIVTGFYILWILGLQYVYAHLLKIGATIFGTIFGLGAKAQIGATPDGHIDFQLNVADKGLAHLPLEPVILPVVLILAWQIFLFIYLKRRTALKLLGINFGVFFVIQIIYVLLLADWGKTAFINSVKETLLHAFGIIVLILIIKDNIFHKIFATTNIKSNSQRTVSKTKN